MKIRFKYVSEKLFERIHAPANPYATYAVVYTVYVLVCFP